jgi:cell division initiation protein
VKGTTNKIMKLSPVNIKRQEFTKAVRGFSPKEVSDFLEKVADEVESAIKESETLRRTIDSLNMEVERYKNIEDSLQKALIATHESAGSAMQKAQNEADWLVKNAEKEAEKIIGGSQEQALLLQKHIAELEEKKAYLIAKLSAMIQTQEDILGLKKQDVVTFPLAVAPEIPEETSLQPEKVKKEEKMSNEDEKRKKLADLFFTGSNEKIDLKNIVDE